MSSYTVGRKPTLPPRTRNHFQLFVHRFLQSCHELHPNTRLGEVEKPHVGSQQQAEEPLSSSSRQEDRAAADRSCSSSTYLQLDVHCWRRHFFPKRVAQRQFKTTHGENVEEITLGIRTVARGIWCLQVHARRGSRNGCVKRTMDVCWTAGADVCQCGNSFIAIGGRFGRTPISHGWPCGPGNHIA